MSFFQTEQYDMIVFISHPYIPIFTLFWKKDRNILYGPFSFVIVLNYRFPMLTLKSLQKGKHGKAPSLKTPFFGNKKETAI